MIKSSFYLKTKCALSSKCSHYLSHQGPASVSLFKGLLVLFDSLFLFRFFETMSYHQHKFAWNSVYVEKARPKLVVILLSLLSEC